MHTKWERNISLVLGVILLVWGGVSAYSFIANSPSLQPGSPAEVEMAEKWIRVLLTVIWVGFGVASVLLMIFMSRVIEIAENFLKKRKSGF